MKISTVLVRLNKYISECGITSRRKADALISEGKVTVNGKIVYELGTKIHPTNDKVFINGKQVTLLDERVYIIFNKPKDCITSLKDEKDRTTVIDYVKVRERIFPVGRLDRGTTGVLFLTNDGEFANKLMHPKFEIKKTYKVTIDKPITTEHSEKLRKGVKLSDGITEPAEVHIIPRTDNKEIGIIIHEGRNKQIRRMFEKLGYDVKKLDRLAYGDISYEGLKRGQWRYFTKKELNSFSNY